MKNTILFLVFLLFFSGCTKKADAPPKTEEPGSSVLQLEPPEFETFPPSSDGVLLDDDSFFLEEVFPPPKQPELVEIDESEGLKIDIVDSIDYLEDGGTIQDAIYIGSKQVGFQSTEFSRQTIQGHPAFCVIVQNHIQVLHQETSIEISTEHRAFETLQGELIGSQSRIQRDNVFIEQIAAVMDENLEITTTIEEQTTQKALPWRIGGRTGGLCTIQVSLFKNPMLDQEERRLSFYDPTRQEIIETVLAAKEIEKVNVLDNTLILRRIEAVYNVPQEQLPITFWTDAKGNIVRSSMPFLGTEGLTTIRTNCNF